MNSRVDLLDGPIDSTLRKFAFPLILSFVINMVYTWVDMYYVSRINTISVAAAGVGEQILFFAFGLGIGFAVGTSIVVARRFGERDYQAASHTATQGFLLMFGFSMLITLLLYFTYPTILKIMNIKGETYILADKYLSAVIWGLPFNFMIFQLNATVRSTGNSVFPMAILIFANVLNIVISPFLIFGIGPFPRMEIFGAGLGTAIAEFIGFLVAVVLIQMGKSGLKLSFQDLKPDYEIITRIVKLGIPASLQLLTISFNRILLSSLTFSFGAEILTTYMLGLRMDLFVFMPIFAVGAAIEITTGQNLGAKKNERVFKYYYSAIKQLSLVMALFGILVFFGGSLFAQIFTKDEKIIQNVAEYLRITAFSYVFFSIGIISVRVISGAGAYLRSLIIVATILFFIQLPFAWFLSKYTFLDYIGIWIGILLSHILFALIGYLQMISGKWISVKV